MIVPPRVPTRLREALKQGGGKGEKKRAPTCSAPMEEYPGKNYQKAGYTIIIVSLTEMSSGYYRDVTVSDTEVILSNEVVPTFLI